jgi:hypothetical protein
LWRAREIVESSGELLRAEAEIAAKKIGQGLAAAVMLYGAVIIAFTGLLTVLAGVTMALAAEVGWVWSLVIVGAALLAAGVVAAWAIGVSFKRKAGGGKHQRSPGERVEDSKATMSAAANPFKSKEEVLGQDPRHAAWQASPGVGAGAGHTNNHYGASPHDHDAHSLKDQAVDFVTRNPAIAAAGAFVLLSAVGPVKAIRVASRGMALASIAASMLDRNRGDGGSGSSFRPPSPTPPPRATRPPPVSSEPRVDPGTAPSGAARPVRPATRADQAYPEEPPIAPQRPSRISTY